MMKPFPQKYDPQTTESELRARWKQDTAFQWDPSLPPELDYVIDTPPPTVSGTLHVGHVYSYTQADIMARYFRMSGRNVLYPIGWDDNGLPTERLVEKVKKVRGGTMPRGEFIDLCREVIPEYHEQYRNLFGRLALSVDWSREYQTISDESRAISQLSFVDLFRKGLIERRLEPVIWDPADRTAIAQAEMDEIEREGLLNYIPFHLEDGTPVEIATTRPELIGGCAALMIHPDHPRAGELVGKQAISPLYGVPVDIIADDTVDPEKGTGIVMCCTFGDVTDIQWWKTHSLALRIVIDEGGRMIEAPGIGGDGWPTVDPESCAAIMERMNGLKVAKAREEMLEALKEQGLVLKQDKTNQIIPVAERSKAPLEIIVTPQWFIRTLDFREEILAKGREIDWQPAYMRQRFESWVEGLKWDWSISRQRHFGVPLPVWYSKRAGEEGKILVATQGQLPVDPLTDLPEGYSRDEVEPETDVLDTWATSSVSPQLVTRTISTELGYEPELHKRLFPMSMRPQAHEIIRTWAFYTIVKALHHQHDVPWKKICISGWCLASDGSKMSKSKNNIIDPIKLLDEYGTDPIRYWTGTSRLGNDTALAPNLLKQGKRLSTKMWNAAKLSRSPAEKTTLQAGTPAELVGKGVISHPVDLWLLGELQKTIESCSAAFEAYEYAKALRDAEDFFWRVFCDNYLELVKYRTRFEGEPNADEVSATHTLWHAMRAVIRLFSPFLPYMCDTLHELFTAEGDAEATVHARGNWPDAADYATGSDSAALGAVLLDTVAAMRKLKSDLSVSLRTPLSTLYVMGKQDDLSGQLEAVLDDIRFVSNADAIAFVSELPGGQQDAAGPEGLVSVTFDIAEQAEQSADS